MSARVAAIDAIAVPADDIACTIALPRPRRLLSQTSLSSTMPAPHSPPTPMPVMMRKVSSEAKSHAAADMIEPMARRSSVHSSAFLRPILSPSQPKPMPPSTEEASVRPTMRPVCGKVTWSDFWIGTSRKATTIRL